MFPIRSGLEPKRKQELLEFQKQAGLKFKDLRLLDLAFHHRSFSNEHNNFHANNERLEFLGDSVLGLVVASYLYKSFEDKPEGELAKIKASSVSEESLSRVAVNLHISRYLVLGKGEEMSGGREKKAILADALEAVIGAFYIDSGFKSVQKFVLKVLESTINSVLNKKFISDYKSLLQEFVQKKFKTVPKYELKKTSGPDHDRTFWFSVSINGKVYGPLSGKTKKEAEQSVAKVAYENLCADVTVSK
ncbi:MULTISPECIES: ribonuclease III [unclassified Treponema]|uniref:ribonuclease III n=1 Tax=unclassified Treponema TaxID=2638727 RepID=UPI0020A29DD6|nr:MULTISPECIES: ribonuclease III [unclassified Treponema]UTC67502.1 ribonuclease III [Treponema sp. OMZ 789]UTC70230.1 ribonuclease III [Treponema sp. OMZ 790]UTC72945.1 ribonuclease III [Treponema sp. OMZ 791]